MVNYQNDSLFKAGAPNSGRIWGYVQTTEVLAGVLERGVREVWESERPVAHVARDLGINSEVLRKHVPHAEADRGEQPKLFEMLRRELADHPSLTVLQDRRGQGPMPSARIPNQRWRNVDFQIRALGWAIVRAESAKT